MDSTTHETKERKVIETNNSVLTEGQSISGGPSVSKCDHKPGPGRQINPKLLKLLAPDDSEYITMECLKNMIKTALGIRFTDDEISTALNDLGFPKDEPIHYRVFLDLISMPLSANICQIDEDFGELLSTEDWQEAMARIGIQLTTDEVQKAVMQTKEKLLGLNDRASKGTEMKNNTNMSELLATSHGDDLNPKDSTIKGKLEECETDDDDDDVFLDVSEEFVSSE